MRRKQSNQEPDLNPETMGTEEDPAGEFFRYAEQETLLTAFDRPGLRKPPEPTRARIALDTVIELHRHGEVVTDRSELKDAVSKRKAVEETGSQDIFEKLFSFSILVPVRRLTGGRDDKLLLHGDVIEWFSGIIDGAAVTTESSRKRAVMRFVNAQFGQDTDRTARAVAQDAWLYSRMVDNAETAATDAELAHEGKLKADEPPEPDFLLADAFVPESQWGGKYNQYVLEGRLADDVTPRAEGMYERSLEQQISTLLTTALYGSGGFWELEADTDADDEDAEQEVASESEPDDPLQGVSLQEFRAYLMGLYENTEPSDIPEHYPEQVAEFDMAYESDRTRTAIYYAIKNKRVER
jgi:hypothetical protein